MQEISGQTGSSSQNSLNAEFGLGDATIIDSLKIEWSSGIVQILTDISVNQYLTISEPSEGGAPTVITATATNVSTTSATLNSIVIPNGLSTSVIFEYEETTGYGNTVPATPSLLDGISQVSVSAEIIGLSAITEYH